MLNRWDPFREMNQLRRAMDRVFDDTLERRWSDQDMGMFDQTYSALALDVLENDDAFLVKAALPGIDPKDLDITYTNDTLTIQGEMKEEQEKEGERYHLRERFFGKFYRQVRLPSAVDANRIQANVENGVLTLTLPKSEEVKPKKITVQNRKMIEGKSK
jgi:HSP20 family protein